MRQLGARSCANLAEPSDEHILHRLYSRLRETASTSTSVRGTAGVAIVETAGGVLSPGPSGTLQADLYRPMRLPAVLVGDHRLGGIGSTISAAESLIMRGYDIDAVICFDDQSKYENAPYLSEYFEKMDIPAFTLPWIPQMEGISEKEEADRMTAYYQTNSRGRHLYQVADRLIETHTRRTVSMDSIASRTKDTIWREYLPSKPLGGSPKPEIQPKALPNNQNHAPTLLCLP